MLDNQVTVPTAHANRIDYVRNIEIPTETFFHVLKSLNTLMAHFFLGISLPLHVYLGHMLIHMKPPRKIFWVFLWPGCIYGIYLGIRSKRGALENSFMFFPIECYSAFTIAILIGCEAHNIPFLDSWSEATVGALITGAIITSSVSTYLIIKLLNNTLYPEIIETNQNDDPFPTTTCNETSSHTIATATIINENEYEESPKAIEIKTIHSIPRNIF